MSCSGCGCKATGSWTLNLEQRGTWCTGEQTAPAVSTTGKRDAAVTPQALLPPLPESPTATYHAVDPDAGVGGVAMAPAADDSGPGGGNWGGVAPLDDPVQEAEAAGPEDALGGENADLLKLGEDGRSPDVIADEILSWKESHRSKDQLLLLYKTCRCLPCYMFPACLNFLAPSWHIYMQLATFYLPDFLICVKPLRFTL
jgi:hypothetical protein